jgi:DNA-binding NarL/FixJ family response regulator
VALLEDCELVSLGLRSMLEPYADRVDLVEPDHVLAGLETAHVVLVDPFTGEGRARSPQVWSRFRAPVVLYSWQEPDDLGELARAEGVVGHVGKCTPVAELISTLEEFAAAEPPRRTLTPHREVPVRPSLSGREREVLELVAGGLSNQEIAETLYVSVNTVKTYIRSAYAKIGVTTRSQAVAWTLLSDG